MLLRLEKKQKMVVLSVQVSPAQLDKKTPKRKLKKDPNGAFKNVFTTFSRSKFKYSNDLFVLKLAETTERSRVSSSTINISLLTTDGEQIRLSPKLEHV